MWIHIYGGQDGLNYIGGGRLGEHKCSTNNLSNWYLLFNTLHIYIYIYIYAYSIQICLSIFAARLDALWFCQQEIHADKDFRLFAAKWWSHANVSWPPELAEKKSLPLGFLCPCGLEFWILCSLFNGKMFLKKMCLQGSTWQRKSDKKACGGHKTTKHTSLLGNRG